MSEMNNGDGGTNTPPMYQPILDVLPDSLHAAVIPTLKEWDANVTKKFQEIHQSYEGLKAYKEFADNNIDVEYAKQAVIFADALQRDPEATLKQVNESFNLGYVPAGQANQQPASSTSDETDDEFDGFNLDDDDLLKNPKFKALYEGFQELKGSLDSQRKQEEEDKEIAEFEEYLNELERTTTEANQPFNRLFVTALMHSGIDGEEAVKQYHQVLAGNTQLPNAEQVNSTTDTTDQQPPVVMGGDGTGGSGSPDGSVDFGSMNKDATNKLVEQILASANDGD